MSKYQSFETEWLLIRPTKGEDARFILELLNSPKWLLHIGDRKVRTIEDAQNYIAAKITPQLERLGYSNYTVIRKSDHAKMGTCGLYDRDDVDGIDIGFAFLPQYEKQGYAFEAASVLMEAAFREFSISQLNAYTTRSNIDSQRLLEKLGMRFEKFTYLPDDPEELMFYTLSK